MAKQKDDLAPTVKGYLDRTSGKVTLELGDVFRQVGPEGQRAIKTLASTAAIGDAPRVQGGRGGRQKGANSRSLKAEIIRRGIEIKNEAGLPWKSVALLVKDRLEVDAAAARSVGQHELAEILERGAAEPVPKIQRILERRKVLPDSAI